jgi:hypothetical protein
VVPSPSGRCQYPDFTSAIRDIADMAGVAAGLVPVANDAKRKVRPGQTEQLPRIAWEGDESISIRHLHFGQRLRIEQIVGTDDSVEMEDVC